MSPSPKRSKIYVFLILLPKENILLVHCFVCELGADIVFMDPHGHVNPRAAGKRISYLSIHPTVQQWVTKRFGECDILHEYSGGLSPGCAASLVSSTGHKIFLKAAPKKNNGVTVRLFEHEMNVLKSLPPGPHLPSVLHTYDSSEWIALAVEHIEGRYPDVNREQDMTLVHDALRTQEMSMSPPPTQLSIPGIKEIAQWWVPRWEEICATPHRFLGSYTSTILNGRYRHKNIPEYAKTVIGKFQDDTVCHFDIRNDNILIDNNEKVVFIDWGIAMTGPWWTDTVILALQAPTVRERLNYLQKWVPSSTMEIVIDFMILFGGSQSWNSQQDIPSHLADYLQDDAERLLSCVATILENEQGNE